MTNVIKFPYYAANVKKTKPLGTVTLDDFLAVIKHPTKQLSQTCNQIRNATRSGDLTLKRKLKEHLFFVNPAVITDMQGRSYSNIVSFTGYLVLDFDKIGEAEVFRDHLFYGYPFILAAWLSVSGKGVRGIVKIPQAVDVDEYKEYFWGLANEYMSSFDGFDMAPQNAVLPLFFSDDPGIKIRSWDDTTLWKTKGEKPGAVRVQTKQFTYKNNPQQQNRYYDWTVSNVINAINAINDNGHPQVRAAAYTLGGRVAGGYIDYNEALELICNLIASNSYLSKGTKGYQKTANEMINQGVNSPLYFNA